MMHVRAAPTPDACRTWPAAIVHYQSSSFAAGRSKGRLSHQPRHLAKHQGYQRRLAAAADAGYGEWADHQTAAADAVPAKV